MDALEVCDCAHSRKQARIAERNNRAPPPSTHLHHSAGCASVPPLSAACPPTRPRPRQPHPEQPLQRPQVQAQPQRQVQALPQLQGPGLHLDPAPGPSEAGPRQGLHQAEKKAKTKSSEHVGPDGGDLSACVRGCVCVREGARDACACSHAQTHANQQPSVLPHPHASLRVSAYLAGH
jgi:hypothetical protein